MEDILLRRIQQINGLKVLTEVDLPLVSILARMEENGVRLDLDLLAKQGAELSKDVASLEKEIFKHCGKPFNIGSPKQLALVLFDELKLPPGKKTKTGFSTDSDVLEGLKGQHPLHFKFRF
jgi:DNA polymerase-1